MNRKLAPCSALAAALFWAASLSVPTAAAQPQATPQAGTQPAGRPPSEPPWIRRAQKRLGLSDSQVGKLEAAFRAQRSVMKPLMEQQKTAMKTLRQQVRSKAADSAIQATLNSLDQAHQSIQAARSKFQMATLASILTPTQRAKMLLAQMHRMRRMREHWQGRGPGRGDRGGYGRDDRRGPGDGN